MPAFPDGHFFCAGRSPDAGSADPKAAAAYMKTRTEPWVAIRCLAGGAIDPVTAYRFAMDSGATAAAIDLLDYRIVETVNGIVNPSSAAQRKNAKGGQK